MQFRHRPASRLRSIGGAILISLVYCMVFVLLLAWLDMVHQEARHRSAGRPPQLGVVLLPGFSGFGVYTILGIFYGAIGGAVLSPLVAAALWRCDPRTAFRRIVPAASVITVVVLVALMAVYWLTYRCGVGWLGRSLAPLSLAPVAYFVYHAFASAAR